MKPNCTTLAVSLLAGVLLLNAQAASAQTNPPPATATRPAKTPSEQTSVPSTRAYPAHVYPYPACRCLLDAYPGKYDASGRHG
jgi:hypothetical protein